MNASDSRVVCSVYGNFPHPAEPTRGPGLIGALAPGGGGVKRKTDIAKAAATCVHAISTQLTYLTGGGAAAVANLQS